jgi:hypothetical protein
MRHVFSEVIFTAVAVDVRRFEVCIAALYLFFEDLEVGGHDRSLVRFATIARLGVARVGTAEQA